MTAHTLTVLSCPPQARYRPSLLNSRAHIAPSSVSEWLPSKAGELRAVRLLIGCLRPCNSWAKNTRSNSFSFLYLERTLMYGGGCGCLGLNPMLSTVCENN